MRAALPVLLVVAAAFPACQKAPKPTPESAVELIQNHYRKINEKQYGEAYKDYEGDGKASGKSLVAFINSYVQTPEIQVTPGTPGPIGGPAGAQTITVPVQVTAVKPDGIRTEYAGEYVLRYGEIEGATPKWQWRIHSQKLERAAAADSTS